MPEEEKKEKEMDYNMAEEEEKEKEMENKIAEEEKNENKNAYKENMEKEEEKHDDTDSLFSSSSGFTSVSNISTTNQKYIWTTERDNILIENAKKILKSCGYVKWDVISNLLNINVKKCRNRAKYLNKIKNKKVK